MDHGVSWTSPFPLSAAPLRYQMKLVVKLPAEEQQTVVRSEIVPQTVSELWESADEKKWREALASYWENPSVRKNLEIEEFMDKLDSELVRQADSEQWRAFLNIYFRWKFTGTYLGQRLADLASNEPERLFRIKDLLFAPDSIDIRKGIERVRY